VFELQAFRRGSCHIFPETEFLKNAGTLNFQRSLVCKGMKSCLCVDSGLFSIFNPCSRAGKWGTRQMFCVVIFSQALEWLVCAGSPSAHNGAKLSENSCNERRERHTG
jgi:hypothetical protein